VIHEGVRQQLDLRSQKVKVFYNSKARRLLFETGQRIWLFNPRKIKRGTPKLQNNWEGAYEVVRRLSDVVYCIRQINTKIK